MGKFPSQIVSYDFYKKCAFGQEGIWDFLERGVVDFRKFFAHFLRRPD